MTKRRTSPVAGPPAPLVRLMPALVVCPRCDRRARVSCSDDWVEARLSCSHCGLVHDGSWGGLEAGTLWMVEGEDGPRRQSPATNTDGRWPERTRHPYRLWLRAECCGGHLVWATNEEHLRHLEEYVGATLRGTGDVWVTPRYVGLRLPTWMKEAKHRDELLRHLGRMRDSLDDSSPA